MYLCHRLAKSEADFELLYTTKTIAQVVERFACYRLDLYQALEKEGPHFAK